MAASSARSVPRAPFVWSDALLAAVLVLIAQVDVWWPEAAVWGDDPVAGPAWGNAVLLGGLAVTVAWRNTAPLAATALASACVIAQAILSGDPAIGLLIAAPVLLLAYAVGARTSRRDAWLGLCCLAFAIAVHDGIDVQTTAELNEASWWWLLILVTWLGGRHVGTRRRAREAQELARRKEEAAAHAEREAVSAERLRIAGELHDVVAHNISVVAVQAGAALEMLDRHPDRVREPLRAIEETAQHTLTEMGAMVGVLRDSGKPAPHGLAALHRLADRVTAAGLAVRMDVEEQLSDLSPGLDLSAYRIVQEAVTNALRHATDAIEVEVVIRRQGRELMLRVADDGRTPDTGHQGGPVTVGVPGHGLVGMRERAAAFGGRLQAGPGPGGGFVVQAWLPIPGPAGG